MAIRPPSRSRNYRSDVSWRMVFRSGALALACALMLGMASASRWASVPMAPADPILGVGVAWAADPAPTKVNLGIGAYRDNEGKPLVLRCVREAEKKIANDETMNKEYLPVQVWGPAASPLVPPCLHMGSTW